MEQRDQTLLDAIDTVCMECSGVDDECHDCRLRKMASRIYKKEDIYSKIIKVSDLIDALQKRTADTREDIQDLSFTGYSMDMILDTIEKDVPRIVVGGTK